MVKPMPQRAAVPYRVLQFIPSGKTALPSFMPAQQRRKTPSCFPAKSPRAMSVAAGIAHPWSATGSLLLI